MRKILLFWLLIQGMNGLLRAQTYSIADGTTWQYVFTSLNSFSVYSNVVDGDTIANGHQYKKVYFCPQYGQKEATFYCAFREEGDKIYAIPSDKNSHLPVVNGETVLYDFSLKEGDQVGENDYNVVEKVDIVEINGQSRKRITFSNDCWIEGIGSLQRSFGYPLADVPTNGSKTVLEMFEQDGKVQYGSRRFTLLTDGVHWTERSSTEDGPAPEIKNPDFDLEEFYVKGDTLIDGTVYKKIYWYEHPYINLRETADGKIYYYTEEGDCLLYDFGWKPISGTPLVYESEYNKKSYFLIAENSYSSYSYLEDGHCYQYIRVQYEPFTFYSHTKDIQLYMGIGLTTGIFTHLFRGDFDCYCFKDLVSIYNSENKLVYQNPLFKENGEFVTSIASLNANPNLSVVNQGKSVEFIWKGSSSYNEGKLLIYNIAGNLLSVRSMEKGRIAIHNLPDGMYVYRLNGETGRFVIGK